VTNALLHEYLASHGFIVIGCPSIGAAERMSSGKPPGLESQVLDMIFITNWAKENLPVDDQRIACLGYSAGGYTNLLFAARYGTIKSVISFDGVRPQVGARFQEYLSFLPSPWRPYLRDFSYLEMRIPTSDGEAEADFSTPYVQQVYSYRRFIRNGMMQHSSYGAEHIFNIFAFSMVPDPVGSNTAIEAWVQAMQVSHMFLRETLLDDAEAKRWLDELPLSEYVLAKQVDVGKTPPPNETEMLGWVAAGNREMLAPFLADSTYHLHLRESMNLEKMEALLGALLVAKMFAEAELGLELWQTLAPSANNVEYYRGELLLLMGNTDEATARFDEIEQKHRFNILRSLLMRAGSHMRSDLDTALKVLDFADSRYPDNMQVLASMLRCYLGKGDSKSARAVCQSMLGIDANSGLAKAVLSQLDSTQ